MKKIVFLPLDERPCTRLFAPTILGHSGDYEIVSPGRDYFGFRKKPGDVERLWSFIKGESKDAKILILPIDTLIYGGLAASRVHFLPQEEIYRRIDRIRELKEQNPSLLIYAYSLVMRCPTYSANAEEPEYYGRHGKEIFQIGVWKHKAKLGLVSSEEADREIAKLHAITQGDEEDYEQRRRKNLLGQIRVLDLVKEGVFHFFITPQDDAATYGYTTMDREVLVEEERKRGIEPINYPGSDEVGMMLLARAVQEDQGRFLTAKVIYPKPECEDCQPLDEDRVVKFTLPKQLLVAGVKRVEDEEADLLLFMNYPIGNGVNTGTMKPTPGYAMRDLPAFAEKISSAINAGKNAVLADGAYGNGGDNELMQLIRKKAPLLSLAGYGGWNSSSNGMGTAIAMGVMNALFGHNEERRMFMAERLYEDCGYCGHARYILWTQIIEKYGFDFDDAKQEHGLAAQLVKDYVNVFMEESYPEIVEEYELYDTYLPWKRFYEAGFLLRKRK